MPVVAMGPVVVAVVVATDTGLKNLLLAAATAFSIAVTAVAIGVGLGVTTGSGAGVGASGSVVVEAGVAGGTYSIVGTGICTICGGLGFTGVLGATGAGVFDEVLLAIVVGGVTVVGAGAVGAGVVVGVSVVGAGVAAGVVDAAGCFGAGVLGAGGGVAVVEAVLLSLVVAGGVGVVAAGVFVVLFWPLVFSVVLLLLV
jgi:hypothetical protein